MNYRHGYHAGNFADVVKHVALTAILAHLKKKDAAFAVIDSHAGRGVYDLGADAARKTGEAQDGIEKLRGLSGVVPDVVRSYLALAADARAYPGSPLVAAHMLRPQDRLTAIEKQPGEMAQLKETLAPFRNAVVEQGDGYARLVKLLPPPSRRGVVLIDPPFEAADEFETLARTIRQALRKFATGIYLIWYPVKSQAAADAFCGEALADGAAKALRVEIAVTPSGEKLSRAGLLVINPPYGFDAQMRDVADFLAPRVGAVTVQWLAGGP